MKDFIRIIDIGQLELINFKNSISRHINIKNFDVVFEIIPFDMTRAMVYIRDLENNTMNRVGQIISYFSNCSLPDDVVFYFYPDYVFFEYYSGDIKAILDISTSFHEAFVHYFEKSHSTSITKRMQLKDFEFNIANKPNIILVENSHFSNLSLKYFNQFIFDFKRNGEFIENIKMNFNNSSVDLFSKSMAIDGQLDFTFTKKEHYCLIDSSGNNKLKLNLIILK